MKYDVYRIKNVVLSIWRSVFLHPGTMSTLEVDWAVIQTQDNCDARNVHLTVVKIEEKKVKMW